MPEPGMGSQNENGSDSGPGHEGSSLGSGRGSSVGGFHPSAKMLNRKTTKGVK